MSGTISVLNNTSPTLSFCSLPEDVTPHILRCLDGKERAKLKGVSLFVKKLEEKSQEKEAAEAFFILSTCSANTLAITTLGCFIFGAGVGHLAVVRKVFPHVKSTISNKVLGEVFERVVKSNYLPVAQELFIPVCNKLGAEFVLPLLRDATEKDRLKYLLPPDLSNLSNNGKLFFLLNGAIANGLLQIVQHLLRNHLNNFDKQELGVALLNAAARGYLAAVQEFPLHAPARISPYFLGTAAQYAAANNHLLVVKYLFTHVSLDRFDIESLNLGLIKAAQRHHTSVVLYLLEHVPLDKLNDALKDSTVKVYLDIKEETEKLHRQITSQHHHS